MVEDGPSEKATISLLCCIAPVAIASSQSKNVSKCSRNPKVQVDFVNCPVACSIVKTGRYQGLSDISSMKGCSKVV